jgi:long-chain acyl-CoA synthetase
MCRIIALSHNRVARHSVFVLMTGDPSPPLQMRGSRAWHAAWPSAVPLTISYPRVPAWWLLERSAASFSSRVAIRELADGTGGEARITTYEALYRAARGAAAGLRALGVNRGTRIAVVLPNSRAFIIGCYATWLAGGITVPANPAARERELELQLRDADVALVIGETGSAAETASRKLGTGFLDTEAFERLATLSPTATPPNEPSDIAVLLYTGGTTGTPKGVALTHYNLVTNTIQFAEWYGFAAGDETCIAALPMFHSGGMSGAMNVPLYAGATLLTFPRFDAAAVARAVTEHRATRLFGVPAMYIALLRNDEGRRANYSFLRACRTNAAPLPSAVKLAFDELVGREVLIEGYGLTEASPLTHANPIGAARLASIGIPLPDTDARVVDLETRKACPIGQPGELLIRGPQVMSGYWRRPGETAAAFENGWLRSGDVAVIDSDGYFSIVSRTKEVINTAGFKVWPREVEDVLYSHPGINMAAVVGVGDSYRGEVVKAWVVLKEEYQARTTEGDVRRYCRERLTPYKVPRFVEFCAELPVTASGKVLRRELHNRPQQ